MASPSTIYLSGARARLHMLQQRLRKGADPADLAERALAELELALTMLEASEQEQRLPTGGGMSATAVHAWLELLEEGAFHRNVLQQMAGAVVVINARDGVVWGNRSSAHALDLSFAIEASIVDLVHPADRHVFECMLGRLQTGGSHARARVRCLTPAREWAELDVLGVRGSAGALDRILTAVPVGAAERTSHLSAS